MKRIFTLILVAILTLSLCACGSNPYAKYEYINKMLDEGDYKGAIAAIVQLAQQNQTDQNGSSATTTTGTQPPKPTDEEKEALRAYVNLMDYLNTYADREDKYYYNYTTQKDYYGQAALKQMYTELQELTAIDKWVGTEYASEEINWNRQEVLASFVVVPDVAISMDYTTTDNMENVSEHNDVTKWFYDADGVLTRLYGESHTKPFFYRNNSSDAHYIYDDQGNLTQIKYGSSNQVYMLVTFTYENGKIAKEHIKTNNREWDVAYAYDEAGRLAKLEWAGSSADPQCITYTYDDKGNLVCEEWIDYSYNMEKIWKDDVHRMEYVYDASGKLTTGTYTAEIWGMDMVAFEWVACKTYETKDSYTYTCDAKGRVTGYTIISTGRIDTYGAGMGQVEDAPDYKNTAYEIHYGDYYIYAPAK